MSPSNPGQKIGGEYGEVRANIDVNTLNKYLDQHVEAVAAPVQVKQFKVSSIPTNVGCETQWFMIS